MESTNICQCCLAKSCYKNINNEYYWAGKIVIYSELLKDTFNISIPSEGCSYICDHCVTRLQDASTFRKEVNFAQTEIQKFSYKKDEKKPSETNDDSKADGESSTGFTEDDFLWEIDKEVKHASDTLTIKCEPETVFEKSSTDISQEKPKASRKHVTNTQTKEKDISGTPKIQKRHKIKKEIRDDSLTLLKYSNICMFKSLKTKYQCYACKETYLKITDLREHTKTHTKVSKIILSGRTYKNADISYLKCNICSDSQNDLTSLTIHLQKEHKIKFSTTENIFVEYKLEEGFNCVICKADFNTFVRLSTHMNTHSTNNVCEICGVFYINRLSLRTHIQSMHRIKSCTLCSAKFEKNYAKFKHMKAVHNVGTSKRYCVLCDKTFLHSYLLVEHRIKEHGLKRPVSDCQQCGKTFLNPQNLKIHIRSVHIRERNYQCDVCGMRFFTKRDEMRHKKSHEDIKSFSCSFCDGKFKSKDSWRRHLRRLHPVTDK